MGVHPLHSPEFASILGDKRWNDKLSDASQAAIDADLAKSREFLRRFQAIDTTGFPEQEKLNQELMVRNLKEGIEGGEVQGLADAGQPDLRHPSPGCRSSRRC